MDIINLLECLPVSHPSLDPSSKAPARVADPDAGRGRARPEAFGVGPNEFLATLGHLRRHALLEKEARLTCEEVLVQPRQGQVLAHHLAPGLNWVGEEDVVAVQG